MPRNAMRRKTVVVALVCASAMCALGMLRPGVGPAGRQVLLAVVAGGREDPELPAVPHPHPDADPPSSRQRFLAPASGSS